MGSVHPNARYILPGNLLCPNYLLGFCSSRKSPDRLHLIFRKPNPMTTRKNLKKMTIKEFSTEVAPTIQMTTAILGLFSLLLIFWQIRQAAKWNRLSSSHNFLDIELVTKLQQSLLAVFTDLKIDPRTVRLSKTESELIWKSESTTIPVKNLLNYFENICAAINVGSVDEENAYAVHSSSIPATFMKFEGIIDIMRDHYGDKELFIEMQKVSKAWDTLNLENHEIQKGKLEALTERHNKALAKLERSKGVQNKTT